MPAGGVDLVEDHPLLARRRRRTGTARPARRPRRTTRSWCRRRRRWLPGDTGGPARSRWDRSYVAESFWSRIGELRMATVSGAGSDSRRVRSTLAGGSGEQLCRRTDREGPCPAAEVDGHGDRPAADDDPAGLLIVFGRGAVEARIGERRDLRAAARSAGGTRPAGRRGESLLSSAQSSLERSNVAGSCGSGTSRRIPAERGELAAPPSLTARPSPGSAWSVKYWNGVLARPLLALEEHRHERGGQQQSGGDPEPAVAHQGGRSLAGRPVADLVVVLGADHELAAGQPDGRPAVHALPVRRVDAVVDPGLAQRLGQLRQRPEVLVVAARSPVSTAWRAWCHSSAHAASSP